MTITADTITNAQIDGLWRETVHHANFRDVDPDLAHACTVAVNYYCDFSPEEQRAARARCADVLNRRARLTDDQIRTLRNDPSTTQELAALCDTALDPALGRDCTKARARIALILMRDEAERADRAGFGAGPDAVRRLRTWRGEHPDNPNISKWIPMRIGASIPVQAIRAAYTSVLDAESAKLTLVPPSKIKEERDQRWNRAREMAAQAAIAEGRKCFAEGAIHDFQIVAIAIGEATLRGWSDTGITFHATKCESCHGSRLTLDKDDCRQACPRCGGDGFEPPIDANREG